MKNSTTLNIQVDPLIYQNAEAVLSALGMPMETAIDVYLKQITLVGGIPFQIKLPPVPDNINADIMSNRDLIANLEESYNQATNGAVDDAADFVIK